LRRELSLLNKAIDLYRDDFLKGFTLPNCPEYDEWQLFQTESLRQTFSTALQNLVTGLTDQRHYETAIPHARRWLAKPMKPLPLGKLV
jgi:DNA-binding SARP family transcriptional activator